MAKIPLKEALEGLKLIKKNIGASPRCNSCIIHRTKIDDRRACELMKELKDLAFSNCTIKTIIFTESVINRNLAKEEIEKIFFYKSSETFSLTRKLLCEYNTQTEFHIDELSEYLKTNTISFYQEI